MKLNQLQPIEGLLADLYHAMLIRRGWSFVRIGDGEVFALKGDPDEPLGLAYREKCVDAGSVTFMQQGLAEACGEADWVGVFNEDAETKEAFIKHDISEPRRQVYAWANRHLALFRDFMMLLRREPVLLIGEPMAEWANACGLSHVTVYAGNSTPRNANDMAPIFEAVEGFNGQLVLVSLGWWAKTVCHHAKQTGRIGIDFGHAADDTLLGRSSPNESKEYGRRGYLEHWLEISPAFSCLYPPESFQ